MPSKKISVLIADDHRLFAEALEAILASEPGSRSSGGRRQARRRSSRRSRSRPT
jgi:DNA-binding NarL/FixJ family response regulator